MNALRITALSMSFLVSAVALAQSIGPAKRAHSVEDKALWEIPGAAQQPMHWTRALDPFDFEKAIGTLSAAPSADPAEALAAYRASVTEVLRRGELDVLAAVTRMSEAQKEDRQSPQTQQRAWAAHRRFYEVEQMLEQAELAGVEALSTMLDEQAIETLKLRLLLFQVSRLPLPLHYGGAELNVAGLLLDRQPGSLSSDDLKMIAYLESRKAILTQIRSRWRKAQFWSMIAGGLENQNELLDRAKSERQATYPDHETLRAANWEFVDRAVGRIEPKLAIAWSADLRRRSVGDVAHIWEDYALALVLQQEPLHEQLGSIVGSDAAVCRALASDFIAGTATWRSLAEQRAIERGIRKGSEPDKPGDDAVPELDETTVTGRAAFREGLSAVLGQPRFTQLRSACGLSSD